MITGFLILVFHNNGILSVIEFFVDAPRTDNAYFLATPRVLRCQRPNFSQIGTSRQLLPALRRFSKFRKSP